MDTKKIEGYTASPWHPMKDSVDVKHLGKLLEECGELIAAVSRCLIQGIDEHDPVYGKLNRDWLHDEIADVAANCHLVTLRFKLDDEYMTDRKNKKMKLLRSWHDMA